MSRLLLRSHTFAIIVILDLNIHQTMWIHWPFFPKTWTKGHWPLDDLWPHVCWGHMCDSTQGSLCPSPMTIHQCMWIQWSILQNTTYIHIHTHTTYIHIHTTYRMSDHIVSYWTQFRRDNNYLMPQSCKQRSKQSSKQTKANSKNNNTSQRPLKYDIISCCNHFISEHPFEVNLITT